MAIRFVGEVGGALGENRGGEGDIKAEREEVRKLRERSVQQSRGEVEARRLLSVVCLWLRQCFPRCVRCFHGGALADLRCSEKQDT